jgi:hypothetical protein
MTIFNLDAATALVARGRSRLTSLQRTGSTGRYAQKPLLVTEW